MTDAWKFKLGTIVTRTNSPFFMGKVKAYAEVGDKSAYYLEPMADVGQLVGPEREDSLAAATFTGDVLNVMARQYSAFDYPEHTYSLHYTGHMGCLLIKADSLPDAGAKATAHLKGYYGVSGLYLMLAPKDEVCLYYIEKVFYKLPPQTYDSLLRAARLRRENEYDKAYSKTEQALYAKLHEELPTLEKLV